MTHYYFKSWLRNPKNEAIIGEFIQIARKVEWIMFYGGRGICLIKVNSTLKKDIAYNMYIRYKNVIICSSFMTKDFLHRK